MNRFILGDTKKISRLTSLAKRILQLYSETESKSTSDMAANKKVCINNISKTCSNTFTLLWTDQASSQFNKIIRQIGTSSQKTSRNDQEHENVL